MPAIARRKSCCHGRDFGREEEERVRSRVRSLWNPLVSEGKGKKRRLGALALRGGCWAGLMGWSFAGRAGSAFLGFFFERNFFFLFQNSKTTTTFDLKLQMSSNQFLKFCINKIHSTRHTHLVFLKYKIKSLFKIE